MFLLKIGLIYVKIEWSTSIKAATCLGDGLTVVGIAFLGGQSFEPFSSANSR